MSKNPQTLRGLKVILNDYMNCFHDLIFCKINTIIYLYNAVYLLQADICHAYQILRNHGIPDERIIVFMKDDIANNEEYVFIIEFAIFFIISSLCVTFLFIFSIRIFVF